MRRSCRDRLRLCTIRPVTTIRYAEREPGFRLVFASAISLIALGTIVYSVSEGWSVFDSFCFAVCTLTTSNVSDPRLVLTNEPIRVFTAFYVLIGLGVLVETAPRRRSRSRRSAAIQRRAKRA